MAGYKVSYKVLRKQGDEMKAAAKLVDGYAERVAQIIGKLGDDAMFSEVRGNLQKLRTQLGESRAVLNTAGELLVKSVESYGGAEVRQVKKVDGMKAHNRDFYKNPIVVASAGGAAGGAVAAGAVSASASASAPPPTATTINYTDNSVNTIYAGAEPAAADVQAIPMTQAGVVRTNSVSADVPMPSGAVNGVTAPSPGDKASSGAAVAAGVGALGGAAVAGGAVLGKAQLKKKRGEQKESEEINAAPEEDNLDAQLQAALERVRNLNEEEKIEE